jgi:hypothetical protein
MAFSRVRMALASLKECVKTSEVSTRHKNSGGGLTIENCVRRRRGGAILPDHTLQYESGNLHVGGSLVFKGLGLVRPFSVFSKTLYHLTVVLV